MSQKHSQGLFGATVPTGVASGRVKVRLRTDLSHLHPSLKPGAMGATAPPVGPWGRCSNRHCGVKFAEVSLDVLWRDLEIADPSYTDASQLEAYERLEAIEHGLVSARKVVGRRGGFKSLTITYRDPVRGLLVYQTTEKAEAGLIEACAGGLGVTVDVEKTR
jgi:hypothetical protein